MLLLLQWVRQHTAAFEERRFPSSFEEVEVGRVLRQGPAPAAGAQAWLLTPLTPTGPVVPVPEV